MTIYGHCRYEDKGGRFLNCEIQDKPLMQLEGCAFNHDPVKSQPNSQVERCIMPNPLLAEVTHEPLSSVKKRFNVASPSFTPSSLAVNGSHATAKTIGLSPKAASAAPFKPRTLTPGKTKLEHFEYIGAEPLQLPACLPRLSPPRLPLRNSIIPTRRIG